MTCTPDEERDAQLTALALIRAAHDDDTTGAEAILNSATERELYSIAGIFAGICADLIVKYTVAHALIQDEEEQAFARTVTAEQAMTEPDLHAAVENNIARLQAALLAEDAIMGDGG